MKSKVALVRCDSYDYDKVKNAVKKGVKLLGGVDNFVKSNEKLLLKPNLLMGFSPEKCVTTHPAVFKAVAELFKNKCKKISYGDSPGFGSPLSAAKKSGIEQAAKETGTELSDFKNGKEIYFEDGIQNKKFYIANGVLDCDAVVSIPKLKSHGFQKFTGSIKNQFGCIAGLTKAEYHVKLPDATDFAKMLVDLDRFVKPRLYIMDGIMAMEGNGPSGGTPKPMNVLIFSADPVALDATICRMMNLAPELVPTTKFGKEFAHGTYLDNEIELVGDDLTLFRDKTFDISRGRISRYKKSGFMQFITNALLPKPAIKKSLCVKCGVCISVCPVNPKAVSWENNDKSNPPVHDYSKCIRCYCCQELCPEHAIIIKKPLLRKIFG
jgi:uncharacterized protein (DUF362 family)/ferredoxin